MSQVTLGRYLFERLNQIKIQTIFGLPGDFNLPLLDKIYEIPGMRWVGNANELNAAYAADGYARIKGMSCMITTFGVGELSALNGIAGSYAEHVGVLHVVGVPSLEAQAKKLLLHHTLGDGDFNAFYRMSSEISETAVMIKDVTTAPAEIDRCIKTAYVMQRPVYLGLPVNLVNAMVPVSLLQTPIDLSLRPNDADSESEVIQTILEMVKQAKNPIIIADACASRHDVKAETEKLIDITQFPSFVTPMGKGSINEQHPRFGGVYVGTLTRPEVKKAVESADLILSIGALLSDFNTGSFSYNYETKNVIEFHSDHTKIKNAVYEGIQMKFVLSKLITKIGEVVKNYKPVAVPAPILANPKTSPETPLRQEWLWNQLGNFLQEGDIVLTETGTSAFGINQTYFPKNTYGISQVLWGSIGFTGGCVLGAAFAAEEIDPKKRVVLFIGDGSLQLTVQEISTMVNWNLKPYLFVLNNDGYTIERLIHGPTAQYNEIQPWNNLELLSTFGAKDYQAVRVATTGEWNILTQNPEFNQNSKIRMIEVMLPTMDAPSNLISQAELTASINAKQ
ncbi:hypothetical protein TBLA_0D02840 [Henningerozyma blattae CBS 6284]|uniref:Pyruvate decarboxylase n=1 Tax=Henningerozyma blattae (strain ATCC 34711 / CBS 6284 / DSM 70876 / NBRC 10599 / NRRL Y-10934 / UCD 77-7) TaxID=1071380 RepID=I2H333_HENB6|nr:hypothetical protein TBLA_0D02840 [Tetrapisispora blattae CBS 6284]CCH60785.1 hypothetical protein TBLA_0D02840 [Tetrapisispora blattae CBS 6284]